MGPILVIGAGLLAVLWFTGWLTPLRLRWAGAAIAALAGLRLLAMGQTLIAAGLFVFAGWLGYGARTLTQNLPLAEARRQDAGDPETLQDARSSR